MAPTSRAQKRKREAPDASQPQDDASSKRRQRHTMQQPVAKKHLDDHYVQESRPQKRRLSVKGGPVEEEVDKEPAKSAEPRRRGRPSKAIASLEEIKQGETPDRGAAEETAELAARRPKRGPAPIDPNPLGPLEFLSRAAADQPHPERRKAGRPSLADQAAREGRDQLAPLSAAATAPKRKRGRPSLNELSVREAQNQATISSALGEPAAATVSKRKRGRPSLSELSLRETQNQPSTSSASEQHTKRGRGRPSMSDKGITSSTHPKKRVGRPSRTSNTDTELIAKDNTTVAQRRRRISGPNMSSQDHHRQEGRRGSELEPTSRRRSQQLAAAAEQEKEAAGSDPTRKPASVTFDAQYQHLQEREQIVRRSTINAKWAPLDEASIGAVRGILSDAQRPVLYRLRDRDRRREQAASALEVVGRIIVSKLAKRHGKGKGNGMPFPPPTLTTGGGAGGASNASGSHEAEMNYERTVDAAQGQERLLNPLLHSVSLLKAEIQKEERLLEDEYAHLRMLEANARAEARTWRERAKAAHVLAPEVRKRGGDDRTLWVGYGDEARDLEVVVPERKSLGVFKELNDDDHELVRLSNQIGSHMESIRGNLLQVAGILPAIVSSKAALQEVLLKHLDAEQCDQVLLG